MTSLVAYLLLGSSTAPVPTVREMIVEAAPGFTLYANGYLDGFAASRRVVVPLTVFL